MPLPSLLEGGEGITKRIQPKRILDLIDKPLPPFPAWIGPRILPKRGTLLFGGQAKIGKSWTMLELVRSLATGDHPFGCQHFSVAENCVVGMIEQELGEYGLQERVQGVFKDAPRYLLAKNLWYVSKEPGMQLDTAEGVRAIENFVGDTKCNVLVMDPIGWMHGWEESSNTDIAKLFLTLELLKKKFVSQELSVIISHHYGKPPKDPDLKGDILDPYNFRGAGKWFDAPDTLVTMARLDNLTTPHEAWNMDVRFTARHGGAPPDMRFVFNRRNDLRVRWEFDKNVGGGLKPLHNGPVPEVDRGDVYEPKKMFF